MPQISFTWDVAVSEIDTWVIVMRINTNISAIVAKNQLSKAESNLEKSLERLSSGYKINTSADDPAGMAISQKMRAQIRGLDQAENNAADGMSVIETAEGAIAEIQSMLTRMKELSVQAANDVNSDEEREAIQKEVDALCKEIDRISTDTEFNTKPLIDGNLSRRVYSDVRGVNQLECSNNIVSGIYGVTVTQDARQAVAVADSAVTLTGTVTEAMAGNIEINGYKVQIDEGDDLNTIATKLMNASDKIGGSVFFTDSMNKTGDVNTAGYAVASTATAGTSSLVFMTNTYGSTEKMSVTCDNDALAAALGITSATTDTGLYAEGSDVVAKFAVDVDGNRVGFANSAVISTSGTQITVKDLNSKTFIMDVPGDVAGTVFNDVAKVNSKATVTTAAQKDINQEVTDIGMMSIHVGANEHQVIELDIPAISCYTIGLDDINVVTFENASKAITAVDEAIMRVSSIRAGLGAVSNRLEHTTNNLQTSNENLTAAVSRMIDTDMAKEMTEYTSQNVLAQAGTSMLAQANERPSTVLQLLQ